jgi:hypothetical protein
MAYADLADLGLTAPTVAHVQVADALLLKGERAASVRPGYGRVLVEADVIALIKGASGSPSRLRYVVDLPRDAKGKLPKLRKGTQFLLFGAPVAGGAGEFQLAAPDAQLAWSPAAAETLRALLVEANSRGAAPVVTGIGRAFHVPGALAGESETQIFLQTAGGQPVSLNVLRRPGETPRWAVALSEIVDESARTPQRHTLLWYRLACTLPAALPRQSLVEADPASRTAIEADYRLVREALGPCGRSRPAAVRR